MNYRPRSVSIVFLLLLVVSAAAMAQGNVRVVLRRPPPNQLRVADLWKVDLDNRTRETFDVYLHGFASEAADGPIVDANSARFQLPPGRRTVSGEQIAPIRILDANEDYKDEIVRAGTLRSGNYRVCVEVRRVADDSLLATDCYDQQVQLLSPPILVAPSDAARVEERLPVFSWLPPAPLQRGLRIGYRIQIVEILGRQSPYDAIRSNPAWFTQTAIAPTLLQYPLRARAFQYGRDYAWMITALETARTGREFIIGESEIWRFRYDSATTGELPPRGRGRGPMVPINVTYQDTGSGFIPRNKPLPQGFIPGYQSPFMVDNAVEINMLQSQLQRVDLGRAVIANIPQLVIKEMLRSCNEGD